MVNTGWKWCPDCGSTKLTSLLGGTLSPRHKWKSPKLANGTSIAAAQETARYVAELEEWIGQQECVHHMERVPGDRCGRCKPCVLGRGNW